MWLSENFFKTSPNTWPPNSPYCNPIDYHACGAVERDTNHASCNAKVQLVTRVKVVLSQLSRDTEKVACGMFRSSLEAVVNAESGFSMSDANCWIWAIDCFLNYKNTYSKYEPRYSTFSSMVCLNCQIYPEHYYIGMPLSSKFQKRWQGLKRQLYQISDLCRDKYGAQKRKEKTPGRWQPPCAGEG